MDILKIRIRKIFNNLGELRMVNKIYGVAKSCGYKSCKKLWEDNPMVKVNISVASARKIK